MLYLLWCLSKFLIRISKEPPTSLEWLEISIRVLLLVVPHLIPSTYHCNTLCWSSRNNLRLVCGIWPNDNDESYFLIHSPNYKDLTIFWKLLCSRIIWDHLNHFFAIRFNSIGVNLNLKNDISANTSVIIITLSQQDNERSNTLFSDE